MRAVVAAALVTLGASLAPAQAPQPPPTFRGGVTLVTIDVSVLDRDGRPVPGLAASDFEIRLNNRVQPIRNVTYLQVAETMAGAVGPSFDAAPAPALAASKVPVATAGRVFIVLVDDLSFSALSGKEMFAAAQRFVTSLPSTDVVGLTTTSGTVTVNPTMDRAPISSALAKIVGTFVDPRVGSGGTPGGAQGDPDQHVGFAQALDIDRGDPAALKDAIAMECFNGDRTIFNTQSLLQVLADSTCASRVQRDARSTATHLKALVEGQARSFAGVIRAMRTATGIKHLVLVTDGVALSQETETMTPVARAAAEAGAQLTILMATPDVTRASDEGRRAAGAGQAAQTDTGASQRRREDNALFLNGAKTTASMTGGTFYQVTGVPDRFFDRIPIAASGIYRLAVEVPPDTQPGRDFTLTARVPKRADLDVHANKHAVATPPPGSNTSAPAPAAPKPLVSPEEQMKRAIATGRALQGVEVTLAPTLRRAQDPGQIAIDVVIGIGAAAKGPVKTTFALVDAGGAIRTSDKTIEPDGSGAPTRIAFSVPVAPGSYKLRVAALDATGAVGSIESAVNAALVKMGALLASDVIVESLSDPRRLLAAIELYPSSPDAAGDILVRLALMGSGADPLVERVAVPEAVDGVLRAEAEFALDRLPPGAYTVRATVLKGATVLGTVTSR